MSLLLETKPKPSGFVSKLSPATVKLETKLGYERAERKSRNIGNIGF
jgi:hypothetical protein